MPKCQSVWLLLILFTLNYIHGYIVYPKDISEEEKHKFYDSVVGVWCPAWRNVICGNDGISYWNECLFQASQQGNPNLEQKKPGPCNSVDCDDCKNEEAPPGMALCGNNGVMFNSTCMYLCYKEEYSMLYRTFQHCKHRSPSKEEIEVTTIETYDSLYDDYMAKVLNVIQENHFNSLTLKNFTLNLEFNDTSIKVTCKKGSVKDLSAFKKLEPMYLYSYSYDIARVKIIFELEALEAGYQKITIQGSGPKQKGYFTLKLGRSKLELITDIKSSDNDCPLIEAISLRITEIDDVALEFSDSITLPNPVLYTDGLIKEKTVNTINEALAPDVLLKLKEIGCLDQRKDLKCYGIFQTRICF